jgi:hypothetical protein
MKMVIIIGYTCLGMRLTCNLIIALLPKLDMEVFHIVMTACCTESNQRIIRDLDSVFLDFLLCGDSCALQLSTLELSHGSEVNMWQLHVIFLLCSWFY